MNVTEVRIRKVRDYEGENAGRFVAEIEYVSPQGKIQMPLTPDISEKLLEFVAPLIAKLASNAAQEIATNIYRAIEDQKHPAIAA